MSDPRDNYLRQIFRRVMLSDAPSAKSGDFYPLTAEGKFRYHVPEEIYQCFKKMIVQADGLDGEQCAHCGRLEGSPDGGCDWCECPGHTAPRGPLGIEGRDLAIERAFNPCPHDFEALTGYPGPGLPRLFECKRCGLRRRA